MPSVHPGGWLSFLVYSFQYVNKLGNIVNKEYKDGIEFFFYLSMAIYLLKAGKLTIQVKEVKQ